MIFFSAIIFSFCVWAVFSHKFRDGIIAKHLLSFSAITAVLAILDPANADAFMTSLCLLISGIAYLAVRRFFHIRAAVKHLRHFHH